MQSTTTRPAPLSYDTATLSAILDTVPMVRSAVRAAAGLTSHASMPVALVDGDAAPTETGSGWHYETPGGTVIRHPSAYRRAGGWHMVYVASTRRIEVGREWLAQELARGLAPKDLRAYWSLRRQAERRGRSVRTYLATSAPIDLVVSLAREAWRAAQASEQIAA